MMEHTHRYTYSLHTLRHDPIRYSSEYSEHYIIMISTSKSTATFCFSVLSLDERF